MTPFVGEPERTRDMVFALAAWAGVATAPAPPRLVLTSRRPHPSITIGRRSSAPATCSSARGPTGGRTSKLARDELGTTPTAPPTAPQTRWRPRPTASCSSPTACGRVVRRNSTHVVRTVAPGGSPLGTHRGLTPPRASPTWGLTAPPGASHASQATLTPGPHVPTWGTTLGHLTAYRTAAIIARGPSTEYCDTMACVVSAPC